MKGGDNTYIHKESTDKYKPSFVVYTRAGLPVLNGEWTLEMLSQSSEMAVTWTWYSSPHLSMVMWQLVEADVQLTAAPVPSVAVALYESAPNTKSQVTFTKPLVQLYSAETVVTGLIAEEKCVNR